MLDESTFDRGVRLLAAGQPEDALEQFKVSLAAAHAEQRADSLYNIAICHVRLGRTDEAVRVVSEAVAIDPGLIVDIADDEDFTPLRTDARFEQLLQRSPGRRELELPVPAGPSDERAAAHESSTTSVALTDISFSSEVIRSASPVIVHFTQDSEYDKKMTHTLSEVMPAYSGRITMGMINIAASPKTAQEFAVTMTPALLIFSNGRVVDYSIGTAASDSVRQKIERALNSSGSELPQITRASLAKAFRGLQYHGQWDHVLLSGLMCAVAYGIASANLSLGGAFMVGATAYGFLIVNPNMGFSPLQKFVATGLMLYLARYGRTILEFFFAK